MTSLRGLECWHRGWIAKLRVPSAAVVAVAVTSLSCDAGLTRTDLLPDTTALTCHLDAGRVSNRGDWLLPGVPPALATRGSEAAIAWVRPQDSQVLLASTSDARLGFVEESVTTVDSKLELPYKVALLPSATGFTLLSFDQMVHLVPLDPAGLPAGAAVPVAALPGSTLALAAAPDGVAVLLSSSELGTPIFARIDGSGSLILGAALASDATVASLTATDDGFAAAWVARGDGQMHVARLDLAGNIVGSPVIVGSAPQQGWADSPRLLSRPGSDRLSLVWSDERQGAPATTHFVHLDPAGALAEPSLTWTGLLAGAAATASGVGVLTWSWNESDGSEMLRLTHVDDGGAGVSTGIVPVAGAQMGLRFTFAAATDGFALVWGDTRTDGALTVVSCGTRPCSQFWGEGSTQPPPADVVQTSYVPQVFAGWLACDVRVPPS